MRQIAFCKLLCSKVMSYFINNFHPLWVLDRALTSAELWSSPIIEFYFITQVVGCCIDELSRGAILYVFAASFEITILHIKTFCRQNPWKWWTPRQMVLILGKNCIQCFPGCKKHLSALLFQFPFYQNRSTLLNHGFQCRIEWQMSLSFGWISWVFDKKEFERKMAGGIFCTLTFMVV